MERHMIVIHGDSNSEADTEESFDGTDHGQEASDQHDSSNEQEIITNEGDNYDDDNGDDSDEGEDDGDDDNSSSYSRSSTADEDDDDSVWSGIRDLSWTSKLVDTFDDKKAELVEGGMSACDVHQAAYRCVLPNLRWNIIMNYVKKIMENTKLCQNPIHRKTLTTKRKLQEDNDYEPVEVMRYAVEKGKYLIQKATGTLSDDDLEDDDGDERSEWTWTHERMKKLGHKDFKEIHSGREDGCTPTSRCQLGWHHFIFLFRNEEHMILASNINDISPRCCPLWNRGDKKFVLDIHT